MRAMVVVLSWVGAHEDGTATPDVTSRAQAPCRAPTRAREWRGGGGASSEAPAAPAGQHHTPRRAVGTQSGLEPREGLLLPRQRKAGGGPRRPPPAHRP